MSVQTFDPSTLALKASERAIAHLKRQLAKSGAQALRLGVKESGCSGYMYELDFIAGSNADDAAVRLADGVTVYVAEAHVPLVRGTEIDYVVAGLNAQLKFRNPRAENECGCGESFSLTEQTES